MQAALAEARRRCPPEWILSDNWLPDCAPDGTWVATAINVTNGPSRRGTSG